MSLFTDGSLISIKDLQQSENGILSVASTESIDLAGKIALAQRHIANDLELFFARRQPVRDFQWMLRPRPKLAEVVVTEPLREWHTHKALALVYGDAYNNQLNDRYYGKWMEYEQLSKRSAEDYYQIGVGFVTDPIPKAKIPILSSAPGNGSAGTYYVGISWLNTMGEEGSLSDVAETTIAGGQQLVVTPTGQPPNVTGWNVYVGVSPETVSLQNELPIETNANWTMAGGPQQGGPPGEGQKPTWFLVDHRAMQRG